MKGLVVDEPWISMILRGDKQWEMRSQATAIRGLIALIRKGSGAVVGVARVTGCRGPLDIEQLRAHAGQHRVPLAEFESGRAAKWTTAWELVDARPLPTPVHYRHPYGAVIWVNLDAGVQAAVEAQLDDEPPIEIRTAPPVGAPRDPEPERKFFTLDPATLVPVAGDGSWFCPDLLRAGQFTVGEKGEERRLDTFEDALRALRQMAIPRWRRPNPQGNWGIVAGKRWARVAELQQAGD